jgi:pyruvate/2-oxoglutarate dehydrogenase complex dihydrolipoamide dehydrogenase (E3) component
VIATGSSPAVPPIPGLGEVAYLTNETVFDLAECPSHLVVIGAGAVGLELAQAFRRLGAAVTVLEAATPLGDEDPECLAVLLDRLAAEGVVVRSAVTVGRVERAPSGIRIVLEAPGGPETIEASHVLLAAGRKPNLDGLGLEAAGIALKGGRIELDRRLRTTNRAVYAVGDAAGGAFTHVASHQAGLVIRNALFRLPVDSGASPIPAVVYTDPELARVGPTEREAREQDKTIRVLRWQFRMNDRAQAERATDGLIKIVTTRGGRILGASIVGAHAGELISTWTLAVARRHNIRAIASLVAPYPTLGEVSVRAAKDYFVPGLTNPWVRRIINVLHRLP